MEAHEAWAGYTGSLIGASVEGAKEKFEALDATERKGWYAVAELAKPKKAEPVKDALPSIR